MRTKEGSRRCARGAGRVQTAAAAAESRTDGRTEAGGRGGWGWLGKVEASVFARVLQDIEGRWLGCVRRVYRILQSERGLAGAIGAARKTGCWWRM